MFYNFILLQGGMVAFGLASGHRTVRRAILVDYRGEAYFTSSIYLFFACKTIIYGLLQVVVQHEVFGVIPFF